MKFELIFLSDGIGKVVIDEPIGYNSLSFDFMQKPKGLGRDISFNGGELQLEFTHTRNHYLPELLYYFNYFGYEAKVQLFINDELIGDLDIAKAETDGLEYLRCKVIQDSKLQTIKRRSKVKVDMFANKDLDGEVMDALVPTNVLVKAKAVYQESKWEFKTTKYSSFRSGDIGVKCAIVQSVIKSEVQDTLTSFIKSSGDFKDFEVIKAKDNIRNIKIVITDFKAKIDALSQYYSASIAIRVGDKINYFFNKSVTNQSNVEYNVDLINFEVNELKRGESIYIYAEANSSPFSNTYIFGGLEITNCNISITAESTSYNSITKAFRLHDVMKQTIKSYSGLQIVAPNFDVGGQFYDNFLFDGKLLRNITDKPFEISLDQLEMSLTEMNADYEVNDRVFFGTYNEYYTNVECGFFDNTQFSAFSKKFNEKYSVNTINYKYKNYQALKENEQPNSSDTIHGETSMLFANKMVENTKAITVEWIRDSFLIDEARKKSIEITKGTSYQNDTDVFCLDCIPNETDQKFTEVSDLNHEWNGTKLILRSNEKLNFNVIGLFENAPFEINAPDSNTGIYTVFKVGNQELQLTWISGGVMTANNNGIRFTSYTYTISKEQIPYISRTNEGVLTNEIKSSETFANLLYSVKRNLVKYYGAYMATCNLFKKEKEVTNTTYYHNGNATTEYEGLSITENQAILPSNPILSPYIYENMVYSNVDIMDFIHLQKELRSKRGFVRSIDKNGNPIKVYPMKMTYKDLEKELTIVAEEKYEPVVMTIQTQGVVITVNNETKLTHLEWEIFDNKLSLFDRGRFRLYKPIFWYNVSINGALPSTINILEEWLKLIK